MSPRTRRTVVVAAVVAVVAVLAVGLPVFQPWRLVVDQRVEEALPGGTGPTDPVTTPTPAPADADPPAGGDATTASPSPEPDETTPTGPRTLLRGELVSHEHQTSGSVAVLELADGSRVLRLEDLQTSNGPDLHVWLSTGPVLEGTDGWFVFADHDHLDLGELKGNQGDQNYPLPDDVDLADWSSVTVWCERFSVSFGATELRTV